jgi:regulator of replication initiation timing
MASIENVLDQLKSKIADLTLENALLNSELEEVRAELEGFKGVQEEVPAESNIE